MTDKLEEIYTRDKEYEYIKVKSDIFYDKVLVATEIIKEFIIKYKLIIYGGTAIDYALRLRGDKIYPDEMLAVPDLDFYSYDNVNHAYELTEILFAAGFQASRAIGALHVETMRVDIGNNHFLADISYKPREVFDKLPTIEYNQMRVLHPDFQRVDFHSALAFPYDNSPTEVIFARWNRDIKRFNKLNTAYPLKRNPTAMALRTITIPKDNFKFIFNGFAAYAVINNWFNTFMVEQNADIPKDIINAKFELNEETMSFNTLDKVFEIVHFDILRASDKIGIIRPKRYETYGAVISEKITGATKNYNVSIQSTRNRFLSVNSVKIRDRSIRIVNIQFLLRYFSALYNITDKPKYAACYKNHYISLLRMIQAYEDTVTDVDLKCPLLLSIDTYGNENLDESKAFSLSYIYRNLDGTPVPPKPSTYEPRKGKPRPSFVYEDSEIFRQSGNLIVVDEVH